jgi:thiol:disulfide interchange protein DsbD
MRTLLTFFTLACAAPCSAATPGAVVRTDQVRAELVAYAPRGLAAGEQAWLGLAIKHEPHWHSYWKNPGDSGMATTLRWALPAGVTAGEIEWPTPQRLALGPLVNHGYEGELLLPVALRLAPGFRENTLQVQLHAEWLVCKDVCIAQSGDFALRFPVAALRPVHLEHAPLFARARAAMPQAVAGASAAAHVDASALAVSVTGLPPAWQGRAVEFFAEDAGVFDHAAAIEQRWRGAKLALRVPLSAQRSESPSTLGAVLVAAIAPRDRAGIALNINLHGGWPVPGLAQAPQSVQPGSAPRPAQPWPGSIGPSGTGLVLLGCAVLALGLGLVLLWQRRR